jgi:hypothetical protein
MASACLAFDQFWTQLAWSINGKSIDTFLRSNTANSDSTFETFVHSFLLPLAMIVASVV